MAKPGRSAPGEDLGRAAERLRHDVGKALRLSAPDSLEPDTEPLRARLRADVVETRRDGSGTRSAAEIFDLWWATSEGHFPVAGELRRRLDRLAAEMAVVRDLGSRIDALGRPELVRLDRLTRDVAQECRELVESTRRTAEKR